MDLLGGLAGSLFASLLGGGVEESAPVPARQTGMGGGSGWWRDRRPRPRDLVDLGEDEEAVLLALAILDL